MWGRSAEVAEMKPDETGAGRGDRVYVAQEGRSRGGAEGHGHGPGDRRARARPGGVCRMGTCSCDAAGGGEHRRRLSGESTWNPFGTVTGRDSVDSGLREASWVFPSPQPGFLSSSPAAAL